MARNRRSKGDVYWYVPGRKTPIAYSTKAASDLIVTLAEEGGTIQEVHDQIIYDIEARKILEKYIAKGYGRIEACTWFR